jgi:hypothetical protein
MSAFEIGFLSFVVACFGLFAVVLGGTAWYCRDRPTKVVRVRVDRAKSAQKAGVAARGSGTALSA